MLKLKGKMENHAHFGRMTGEAAHKAAEIFLELRAENERLRRALLQIVEDAESPQFFYDRMGPQFTSPSGGEYESTSDFLAKCNELASTARAALFSTSTDELPDVGQWSDDERARSCQRSDIGENSKETSPKVI